MNNLCSEDIINKEFNSYVDYGFFGGTLRITNSKTLQKWKDNGKYDELINEGYIYAKGCGRFRVEVCNCSKCRKVLKNE